MKSVLILMIGCVLSLSAICSQVEYSPPDHQSYSIEESMSIDSAVECNISTEFNESVTGYESVSFDLFVHPVHVVPLFVKSVACFDGQYLIKDYDSPLVLVEQPPKFLNNTSFITEHNRSTSGNLATNVLSSGPENLKCNSAFLSSNWEPYLPYDTLRC